VSSDAVRGDLRSRKFLLRILIFKGFTARRLYKSFGVKGLIIYSEEEKGKKSSSIDIVAISDAPTQQEESVLFGSSTSLHGTVCLTYIKLMDPIVTRDKTI
jgi:hypothetical protein